MRTVTLLLILAWAPLMSFAQNVESIETEDPTEPPTTQSDFFSDDLPEPLQPEVQNDRVESPPPIGSRAVEQPEPEVRPEPTYSPVKTTPELDPVPEYEPKPVAPAQNSAPKPAPVVAPKPPNPNPTVPAQIAEPKPVAPAPVPARVIPAEATPPLVESSIDPSAFPEGEKLANIETGDWMVSGSLSYITTVFPNSSKTSTFDFGVRSGYFVIDGLALGGRFTYLTDQDDITVSMLGPFAQFHFYNFKSLVLYAGVGYSWGLTESTVNGRLDVDTGLNFHITPSVAFGPYFRYQRLVGLENDWDRFRFGASFGIYL